MNLQIIKLQRVLFKYLNSSENKKRQLVEALKKKQICASNTLKVNLAERLAVVLSKQIQHCYSSLLPLDLGLQEQKEKFCQNIFMLFKQLGFQSLQISVALQIYDIFNFQSRLQSPQMSSQKLIRTNYQLLENIWDPAKAVFKDCLCPKAPSNLEEEKKIQRCYKCHQPCHTDCFWSRERDELFQCPFCYILECQPNKQIRQVIFAGYIPILKKQKVEYRVNFNLDQKLKADKSIYLEARCVKFNSKNRFEFAWPDNGAFYLGKIKLFDFKPLQTSSPLKRRPDEPIKLDRVKLSAENEIIIEERNNSDQTYRISKKCNSLVVILAVSDLSSELVFSKLEKNMLTIDESKQIIKEYLDHESQQLIIEKLSISLKCQYYGNKITVPVRSRFCTTHYQPFDLLNFINSSIVMKSSSKRWKCPICDKRAYDIVVDRYILELMNKNSKANEIVFKRNAEPEILEQNNELDIDEELGIKENQAFLGLIDLDSSEQNQELSVSRSKSNNINFLSLDNDQNKGQDRREKQVCMSNGERDSIFSLEVCDFVSKANEKKADQQNLQPLKRILQIIAETPQVQTIRKQKRPNDPIEQRSKEKVIHKITPYLNLVQISSDEQLEKGHPAGLASEKAKEKVVQIQNRTVINSTNLKNSNGANSSHHKNQSNDQSKTHNNEIVPASEPKSRAMEQEVIEICSDSEDEETSRLLKKQLEKLEIARGSFDKEEEVQITEEDTEIFESLFNKLLSSNN